MMKTHKEIQEAYRAGLRRDRRKAAPWLALLFIVGITCLLLPFCGCATGLNTQWQWTHGEAGRLDYEAEQLITDPEYQEIYNLRYRGHWLQIFVVGPARLRRICGNIGGSQCVIGQRVYILGGPLPNGRTYISQWGLGHEMGHVFGLDVDHLCEGL